MAITTNAELKTALASWSKRSDLTDLLPDFIAYPHQEIARTLRCTVMESTSDLTMSGERISIPTGFRAIKRAYIDLTPRRRLLVTSSEKRVDMTSEYASTTYPTHIAVEGAYLTFAPIFTSTTATLKLLFYKEPAVLSVAGDTNAVLTKYPYLYLNGALAELFRYIEDDNLADRYEARFRAMIEAINKSEGSDAMSGPLQGSPAAGGIV